MATPPDPKQQGLIDIHAQLDAMSGLAPHQNFFRMVAKTKEDLIDILNAENTPQVEEKLAAIRYNIAVTLSLGEGGPNEAALKAITDKINVLLPGGKTALENGIDQLLSFVGTPVKGVNDELRGKKGGYKGIADNLQNKLYALGIRSRAQVDKLIADKKAIDLLKTIFGAIGSNWAQAAIALDRIHDKKAPIKAPLAEPIGPEREKLLRTIFADKDLRNALQTALPAFQTNVFTAYWRASTAVKEYQDVFWDDYYVPFVRASATPGDFSRDNQRTAFLASSQFAKFRDEIVKEDVGRGFRYANLADNSGGLYQNGGTIGITPNTAAGTATISIPNNVIEKQGTFHLDDAKTQANVVKGDIVITDGTNTHRHPIPTGASTVNVPLPQLQTATAVRTELKVTPNIAYKSEADEAPLEFKTPPETLELSLNQAAINSLLAGNTPDRPKDIAIAGIDISRGHEIRNLPKVLTGKVVPGSQPKVEIKNAAGTVVKTDIPLAHPTTGDFSILLDAATLPNGDYTFHITSSFGPNVSPSYDFAQKVNLVTPVIASLAIEGPDTSVDITTPNIVLSGKGEPGRNVEVTVNGAALPVVTVQPDGKWQMPITGLVKGPVNINTRMRDAAGTGWEPTVSRVYNCTYEAPVTTPASLSIEGPDTSTPIAADNIVLKGKGEPGRKVKVKVNTTNLPVVTVQPDGKREIPVTGLKKGPVNITTRMRDAAGTGWEAAVSRVYNCVYEAPKTTRPTFTEPGHNVFKDNPVTVKGTAEPGKLIQIQRRDTTITPNRWVDIGGRVRADAAGTWSLNIGRMRVGPQRIRAVPENAAGRLETRNATQHTFEVGHFQIGPITVARPTPRIGTQTNISSTLNVSIGESLKIGYKKTGGAVTPLVDVTANAATYNLNENANLPHGDYILVVQHGTHTPAPAEEKNFTVNPDPVAINQPVPNADRAVRDYAFTGTGEPNQQVEAIVTINGKDTSYTAATHPAFKTNGAGEWTLPLHDLPRGPITVKVTIAGETQTLNRNRDVASRRPILNQEHVRITEDDTHLRFSGYLDHAGLDCDVIQIQDETGKPIHTVSLGSATLASRARNFMRNLGSLNFARRRDNVFHVEMLAAAAGLTKAGDSKKLTLVPIRHDGTPMDKFTSQIQVSMEESEAKKKREQKEKLKALSAEATAPSGIVKEPNVAFSGKSNAPRVALWKVGMFRRKIGVQYVPVTSGAWNTSDTILKDGNYEYAVAPVDEHGNIGKSSPIKFRVELSDEHKPKKKRREFWKKGKKKGEGSSDAATRPEGAGSSSTSGAGERAGSSAGGSGKKENIFKRARRTFVAGDNAAVKALNEAKLGQKAKEVFDGTVGGDYVFKK